MSEDEHQKRPQPEGQSRGQEAQWRRSTIFSTEGLSHEDLVSRFGNFLSDAERSGSRYTVLDSHAQIIRQVIRYPVAHAENCSPEELNDTDKEKVEFCQPLLYALDAVAYDQYEPGIISAESNARESFWDYYQSTQKSTISLDKDQVMLLNAITEVIGIPHKKDQSAVEIPEKLHLSVWDYLHHPGKSHTAADPAEAEIIADLRSEIDQGVEGVERLHDIPFYPYLSPEYAQRLKEIRSESQIGRFFRAKGLFRATTPEAKDPTCLPIEIMNNMDHNIIPPLIAQEAAYDDAVQQWTSWKKSVGKIRMAYQFIAYPNLDRAEKLYQQRTKKNPLALGPGSYKSSIDEYINDAIGHPNINTEEYPHRGPIHLNDEELKILGKITAARLLPFNPKKHTYTFSELALYRSANRQFSDMTKPSDPFKLH